MSAKRCPSYSVELMGYGTAPEPTILTLYMTRLTPEQQSWWYSRQRLTEAQNTEVSLIEVPLNQMN